MPHSLVLNLLPLSPIYANYLTGRHFHALFLTLVSSVDPELGAMLHDSTMNKAFTLSPLQIQKQGIVKQTLTWEYTREIKPGIPCWWRISLLDDELFGRLTKLWLNLNPEQPWHLGPANLKITSILGTKQSTQPWANACSYKQLYEEASETERAINLVFSTPTAFRQGKYDTALPTHETVFNSLLSRWRKYSGIEFEEINFDPIFPSYFDIKTAITKDSRSKFIGCVGTMGYRILGDLEPIQIKQLNALADFALYCGVGRKTTMGMGMARRVS